MTTENTTAGELGGRTGGANDASKSGGSGSSFNADSTSRTLARQLWAGGRKVGEVRGEVFHKRVRSSEHQLRKPPAWACDVAALREAERAGARVVELFDEDTGETVRAPLAAFWQHGFTFDRGCGRQQGLVLSHWQPAGEELALQLGFQF
jgi:hypothetical protein